jgi:hypothetical protein
MSRWKLYGRCKKIVNYYLQIGFMLTIISVVIGYMLTKDDVVRFVVLVALTIIAMSWNCAEGYYKYLHDILFRKVSKEVLYVFSYHNSKRLSDKEDWIIEKIRSYKMKRVTMRFYTEYQQSVIEHNRRMNEIKAPKRKRKCLTNPGPKVFECFCVPMCKDFKKEDKIEICYLKGSNTIVELKKLPKEELNVELCLEKKDQALEEVEKDYKLKKIIGTIIFTSICICMYLFLCLIAIVVGAY